MMHVLTVCVFPFLHEQAQRHYWNGQLETARRCGMGAYCCDTTAVLFYVFSLLAGFVLIALWMTGVLFCSPLPQYDKTC